MIETACHPYSAILAASSTDVAFASKVPTLTEPENDGIYRLGTNDGGFAQNGVFIVPYATAADDSTFSLRVIGWRRVGTRATPALWVPVTLCELACTVGSATGVNTTPVVAAQRFVDTITVTTGNAGIGLEVVSPADNTIAHAVVDLKGCQRMEVTFKITSGPTDMNALVALL